MNRLEATVTTIGDMKGLSYTELANKYVEALKAAKDARRDLLAELIAMCESHAACYGPKPDIRLGVDLLRPMPDSQSIGWQVAELLRQELRGCR